MSGTSTSALFNATYYLQNNPDVVAAIAKGQFSSALDHFNKFGQFENRSPNIIFNGAQYLINNADVAAAVGSKQLASAWAHFTTFGIAELRSSGTYTGTFNEAAYLAANPDVAAAVKAGSFINGYQHFLLFGQNEVRSGVPTLTTGQTFTLTTGIDTPTSLPGTAGNDTFFGTIGTGATLNVGDSIDGKAGLNALNIVDTSTTGLNDLVGVTLTNIQTISLQNVSTTTTAELLDLSSTTGVSKVIAVNTPNLNSDNFIGLATGTQVVASGAGTGASSTVNFLMKTLADAVSVGVDGGVNGVTFSAGSSSAATAATITSTGAANGKTSSTDTFNLTANTGAATGTVKTLAINATTNLVATLKAADYITTGAALTASGSATIVNVGALTNFKTIDASGLTTGGLTVALGSNTTSFKGGASGNVVTTGLAAPGTATTLGTTVAAAINAGTGTGNVLVVNATNDVNTAALTAVYAGFNTIKTAGQTIDLSLFTNSAITAEQVSGDTTLNKLNAAQAAAITVVGTGTAAGSTFNVIGATTPGQSDVLGLTINDSATAANTVFLGAISAAGVETINVNIANAFDSVNIASLANVAALTNLTISGGAGAGVSVGSGVVQGNSIFDFSGVTGIVNLDLYGTNGASGASLIKFGSGGSNTSLSSTAGNTVIYSGNTGGKAFNQNVLNLGGSSNATITLGTHTGTDFVLFKGDTTKNSAIDSFVTVNNFNVGLTFATSDSIGVAFTNSTSPSNTPTFATGGVNVAANATVTNGVVTFSGITSATTLSNLIAAAENGLGAVSNSAVAFQFNGNTYFVQTPTLAANTALNDHVAALIGVTGVTSVALSTTTPTGANIGHTLFIG